MRKILKHYPLTLPGTAAVSTVLFVFGKGYADSDYQSIFISSVFFLILFIIASVLFYYSGRYRHNNITVKIKGEISSSSVSGNSIVIAFEQPPPVFFRYSAVIKGYFHVTGKSFRYFRRFISDRSGIIESGFRLKTPGIIDAESIYCLEDIFGLMRIPCAGKEIISIPVIPGLPDNAVRNIKDSMSSFVKNKKPDENDFEKILMREYIRGDRSRDINWKASSKSNTIFTRIAPGNDNEVKQINIVYCSDPDLFGESVYQGFLVFRFFREYFRFYLNSLLTAENYKFSVFINSKNITVADINGLNAVNRELSLQEIRNDFEKIFSESEGPFAVFCEKPEMIEDLEPFFINSSGFCFFYPRIIKQENPDMKRDEENRYMIDGSGFDSPGEGIFRD